MHFQSCRLESSWRFFYFSFVYNCIWLQKLQMGMNRLQLMQFELAIMLMDSIPLTAENLQNVFFTQFSWDLKIGGYIIHRKMCPISIIFLLLYYITILLSKDLTSSFSKWMLDLIFVPLLIYDMFFKFCSFQFWSDKVEGKGVSWRDWLMASWS